MPGHPPKLLVCHPASPNSGVDSLAVSFSWTPDALVLSFHLAADPGSLRIPAPQTPAATDGLWQRTCCEAFIAPSQSAEYLEFNFSPSGQWAIYHFGDYRCRDERFQPSGAPAIAFTPLADGFRLDATIPGRLLPPTTEFDIGLSAVVEDSAGHKSYWALAHCAAAPDFHLRPSFTLKLAPP